MTPWAAKNIAKVNALQKMIFWPEFRKARGRNLHWAILALRQVLVVLGYFIFLVVEVLLGRNGFRPQYIFLRYEEVASDFLTLIASKLIKESTATVAVLLSVPCF